uniref:COesterase domain-containing protein n=1 Tax=Macrostomum lignano TaxID=282301 RepID=A0A1I8F466_9PLAT
TDNQYERVQTTTTQGYGGQRTAGRSRRICYADMTAPGQQLLLAKVQSVPQERFVLYGQSIGTVQLWIWIWHPVNPAGVCAAQPRCRTRVAFPDTSRTCRQRHHGRRAVSGRRGQYVPHEDEGAGLARRRRASMTCRDLCAFLLAAVTVAHRRQINPPDMEDPPAAPTHAAHRGRADCLEAFTPTRLRGSTIACVLIRTVRSRKDQSYGASTGQPLREVICTPILHCAATVDWQSIGTVPTCGFGHPGQPAGSVLHSPLLSGPEGGFSGHSSRTWFFDAFPKRRSDQHIAHGLAIYERLPRSVDPLWVEGAANNDIELFPQYLLRLRSFLYDELEAMNASIGADDGQSRCRRRDRLQLRPETKVRACATNLS